MLDAFAMQQGGTQYRRLVAAFQRIFGATIFFGTDLQRERATVVHRARFNFMSEARIWYSRVPDQKLLRGAFQNVIVLSDEFYRAFSIAPCRRLGGGHTARGRERVPLFGDFGLISQLGSADYVRSRKFREKLEGWLDLVRTMWSQCPLRSIKTAPDCFLTVRMPSFLLELE